MTDRNIKANSPHPTSFVEKRRLAIIKGYRVHQKRTPGNEARIVTPSQTIGPFFPQSLLAENENDLTRLGPDKPRAQGELIYITGAVTDEDGAPVSGALIEIWQANKWGKYDHPADASKKPIDENFRNFGRTLTDKDGRYTFSSIRPGAYPNPGYDNWFRPPHVHFSIFAAGLMQRIITQMYFPDEELNDIDPILNSVENLDTRARLIAEQVSAPSDASAGAVVYRFDIVLRGRQETPFFVE